MKNKPTALVVCPGRGTYNKAELGYLTRHHSQREDMLSAFEAIREEAGQTSLLELDTASRYSVARHTRGDNASLLIHACAYGDFLSIDRDAFDIVALTGNSMGWYVALACAGAVTMTGGAKIVNTMGAIMQENLVGGQIIYPLVDDNWVEVPGRRDDILALLRETNNLKGAQAFVSIELGGMLVLAGNKKGLKHLQDTLPVLDRFPMELANHAAFHTALQADNSARGFAALDLGLFEQPGIPLIDGRGKVWQPGISDLKQMYDYTFGHQVTHPFSFTRAIEVGVREYAPDHLIILGPGTTLGGAVAQSLIGINWRGLSSKADFAERQRTSPILLSMGRDDQRGDVVSHA